MFKQIIFLIILIIPYSINSDCSGSPSFITQALNAGFVGLIKVQHKFFHGYFFETLDVIKSDGDDTNILIWGPSFTGLERDPLECVEGETLLVAVEKVDKDYMVENAYIRIVEKSYSNAYHTTVCGNNSLLVKRNIAIGQILNYVGTKVIDNESKFFPYKEEQMNYQDLKSILADTLKIK